MGVKSTVTLTRSEAEKRFVRFYAEAQKERILAEVRKTAPEFEVYDLPYTLRPDGFDVSDEDLVLIWAHVETKRRCGDLSKEARHLVVDMDDTTLENELERVHDEAKGGEGFENYIVKPDDREW